MDTQEAGGMLTHPMVHRSPLLDTSATREDTRAMYQAGRTLPWVANPAALDAIEAPEARNLVAGLLRWVHCDLACFLWPMLVVGRTAEVPH